MKKTSAMDWEPNRGLDLLDWIAIVQPICYFVCGNIVAWLCHLVKPGGIFCLRVIYCLTNVNTRLFCRNCIDKPNVQYFLTIKKRVIQPNQIIAIHWGIHCIVFVYGLVLLSILQRLLPMGQLKKSCTSGIIFLLTKLPVNLQS